MKIRTLIAICQGCGRTTTYKPDQVLESADSLVEWLRTHLEQCVCGEKTCDVKIPIEEVEEG